MFSTPFAAFAERFEASDANAISCPDPVLLWLMLGLSLKPFAGDVPLGVETRRVAGTQVVVVVVDANVHVSRT